MYRSVGQNPLGHLEHAVARHERRGSATGEVHRVGRTHAGDLQEIAKALGDDQTEAGAPSLKKRVEADRGAVSEVLDVSDIDTGLIEQLLEAGPNTLCR